MLAILWLSLAPTLSWAASYACETEFGETLLLRQTVLKAGARCESCGTAGAEIPRELVARTQSFNEGVSLPAKPSAPKLRRREFRRGERTAYLDTRYVRHPGPAFTFVLSCGAAGERCRGRFTGSADTERLQLSTKLSDERGKPAGRTEIILGAREYLGFIVRVFKEGAPERPVSASGELKFFREDPLFVHDVGVDETLELAPGWYERIAALELKIRCEKSTL